MSVQPYTGTSVELLKALRSGGFKLDAFAEFVHTATKRRITWQTVSQWCDGSLHFPADLVPVLAAFVEERADVVLNAYTRPAGFGVEREPGGAIAGIRESFRGCRRSMGRLLAGMEDATGDDSDEGAEVSLAEKRALLDDVRAHRAELEELERALEAGLKPRAAGRPA